MLRPSAFQKNCSSSDSSNKVETSTSKSILRPSSFQLAAVGSQKPSTGTNDNEESISDVSTTSTIVSTDTSAASKSDTKISSTTNNSDDSTNPFSNTRIKEADDDDCEGSPKSGSNNAEQNATTTTTITTTTSPKIAVGTLLGARNVFAPSTPTLFAAATSKTNSIRNGSESAIGFVFGENIHERIVGAPDAGTSSTNEKISTESCSGNELFAAAAASSTSASAASSSNAESSNHASSSNGSAKDQSKESSRVEDLTKVAREYEESRIQKRKFDEVETFTGEENEVNVLDVSCKLFAFVASNWEERGPGSLRLNDPKVLSGETTTSKSSRVVFRTSGNLRVVLNTKVWAGMVVAKPSQKSLRLTAIDPTNGQIKIFLAMARPDDVSNLYAALKKRIEAEKEKTEVDSELPSQDDTDKESDGSIPKPTGNEENNDEPSAKKDKK